MFGRIAADGGTGLKTFAALWISVGIRPASRGEPARGPGEEDPPRALR